MTDLVRVAVRCRPFDEREHALAGGLEKVVDVKGNTCTIYAKKDNPHKQDKSFTFDYCYDEDAEQETIFNQLGEPLVEKALAGYNCTIFAYGQTSSGKTYTMTGTKENPGFIPRMNKRVFDKLLKPDNENRKFMVTVSYMEIYQETVFDLLNPSGKDLKVREHPSLGVYVEGLAELVVKNHNDVRRLLMQGNAVRQVASTKMNHVSSRSHAIFCLRIEQRDESTGEPISYQAKINMVDLAGSERVKSSGATGSRLREGASINKSLSALGNVINALADPQRRKKHIPYRDAKLTRILQEALGGNSCTIMLANVSPSTLNYEETLSTLKYANRAKNIQNIVKKNNDDHSQLIQELRAEIATLKKQLEAYRNGDVPFPESMMEGTEGQQASYEEKVTRMEDVIQELEAAKSQAWEERERMSNIFEMERRRNMQNHGILSWAVEKLRDENEGLKEELEKLSSARHDLTSVYQFQKEKVEGLKANLELLVIDYNEGMKKASKDENIMRMKFMKIKKAKEELKLEHQELKRIRKELRTLIENQKVEKEKLFGMVFPDVDNTQGGSKSESSVSPTSPPTYIKKNGWTNDAKDSSTFSLADGDDGDLPEDIKKLRDEKEYFEAKVRVQEEELQRLRSDLEVTFEKHSLEREMLKYQIHQQFENQFKEQKVSLHTIESNYQMMLAASYRDCMVLAKKNAELCHAFKCTNDSPDTDKLVEQLRHRSNGSFEVAERDPLPLDPDQIKLSGNQIYYANPKIPPAAMITLDAHLPANTRKMSITTGKSRPRPASAITVASSAKSRLKDVSNQGEEETKEETLRPPRTIKSAMRRSSLDSDTMTKKTQGRRITFEANVIRATRQQRPRTAK